MNTYQQPELDFDKTLRQIKKHWRKFALAAALIALVPLALSSFYTVEPDEEAVVLRLGRHLTTTGPGLHFKLPFGVDQAIKVKTRLILQEEFGFRTQSTSGKRTKYSESGFSEESLMLTGDLNVADVQWITQFQIADPQKFLFHIRDPIQSIRDISEAVMRRVVGDRLVNDVLTVGRTEIASEAKKLTQDIFDQYDVGVHVVSIKLQDVNPPGPVKPSFNEVNEAKQEQEQAINQAEKQYNKIIPESRGRAEQKIAEAEGYADALVNRAQGDAERFTQQLKEYRKAKNITRDRLYLEAMENLVQRTKNITVIDPNVKGLLPVFDNNGRLPSSGGK